MRLQPDRFDRGLHNLRVRVVANDECNEELITFGEPEEFAVIDDVHRVFVVRTGADERTDLVEDSGEVEDQFHTLVELVLGHQVRKEFTA